MFSDIINDAVKDDLESKDQILAKDHWINKPLVGENDKTLLLTAIDEGNHDCMSILLKSGADVNLYSHELHVTPLIYATRKRDLEAMKMLLLFGADVNAASFKSGETALHEACNRSFTEAVTFLLNQPKIQVDIKDSKGGKTPLFCAMKSKDEVAMTLLIASGANLDHQIVNKTLREHIKQRMNHFDPDAIHVVKKANIARQTSQTTLEKLESIIDDLQNNDDLELFQSLLLEVGEQDLENYRSSGFTLLQKACWSSKSELVKALLEQGMNINGLSETTKMAPILIAASKGDMKTLQVLMKHHPDLKVTTLTTQDTILHCFLKQDQNMNIEDLKQLLNPDNEEMDKEIKRIINKANNIGNTALHYAAQRWPAEAVRVLLECGANVGMKNQFDEVAITQIPAETFEDFLNTFCMKTNSMDLNHENFELTFDYTFLAPSNDNLPKTLQKIDPEDPAISKLVDSSEKFPLPETEALWHLGQSKEHRHLLKHPVVTSFLWLKWLRIRRYFNRNLRFYLLFTYLLTWYIFQNFGGLTLNPDKTRSIPFFYGLFIFFAVLVIGFILVDWKNDLKDIMRVQEEDEFNSDAGGLDCTDVFKLILSNWIEAALISGLILIIIFGASSLFPALIITTALLSIREFFQVTVSLRRYLLGPENWIEVTTIILITIILFQKDTEDSILLKRHLAAIAIVLSWAELITLVGKHPKLTRYNVYVTMFYKVLATFCFFLLWYAFFIVAFGLAFYILLHKDDGSEIGQEDYIYFNQPWLALIKTSTMFVGELEFSDIPINVDHYLSPLAYAFFLSFVFLIVVVLMNLLNGLAVSDTGIIQEKAEIVTYISRVDTISYTESVLLGDPFQFLSNWPAFKWVKNIPNLSCWTPLHKHACIQDVFYKMTGATGILLFYSFMKEAKLTMKPNSRSQQSCQQCISVHQMDQSILTSAKKIIAENSKMDKIQTMESRLEAIEDLLKKMYEKLN